MDPKELTNLTQLIPSSTSLATTTQIPSSDQIVNLLATKYRQLDRSATWIGDSVLAVLNPLQTLPDISDASKDEYIDRTFKLREGKGGDSVQPHVYELACRAYLMMRRTGETQSVVFTGQTGAGSTTQRQLFTSQLLRLSASSKKDSRLAQQIQALDTLLSSFGSAKTALNPSASRHSSFLELHFNRAGKLAGAKVLAFGLDKSRVCSLTRDERSYHVFYQLLAGATQAERTALGLLDDFTEYALFQTSGCYRLPHGPGSDDSIAFEELRAALSVLGFKPRHVSSIFRLLSAILLLGNIVFLDPEPGREAISEVATIENVDVLIAVAKLLGTDPDELQRALTTRVRWIRKETTSTFLHAEGAAVQRDQLVASLYSIVFAFVVETANHKLFPGDEAIAELQTNGGSSILTLDVPGFVSKTPDRPSSTVLVQALNGFEEFSSNYQNEVLHYWLEELLFDGDSGMAARAQEDGVRLADVIPPGGITRLELLRGGRVGGKADRKPGGLLGGMAKTCSSVRKGASADEADEQLVQGMREHYSAHTSFVASPSGPGAKSAFGIQHFAGRVAYDTRGMIEHNLDLLDAEFVAMFRASDDGFISKLFSGPSLATEVHPLDEITIVSAQVSNQPLRRPSPIIQSSSVLPSETDFTASLIDPLEIHPLSSQLNATLSLILNLMERTRVWSVFNLRPNDTGHPGTVDSKRLNAQVSAMLIPELIARKKVDFIFDAEYEHFADRHGISNPSPASTDEFLQEQRLNPNLDYALGTSRVWLTYRAWRVVEDRLRVLEPPDQVTRSGSNLDSPTVSAAAASQYAQPLQSASRSTFGGTDWGAGGDLGSPGLGHTESVDDLLLAGATTPAGTGGGGGGYNQSFRAQGYNFEGEEMTPAGYVQSSNLASDVWGFDSDKEQGGAGVGFNSAPGEAKNKEGVLDAQGRPKNVTAKGTTVEELPTSKGRRAWVALVWLLTWWIPSFLLTYVGRMKRPDVRLAWREKVTLCMLIGFACGTVIFYIVVFGKIICPEYDKVWNTKEVSYHATASTFYVSVRGSVYDLTKFYKLQHSDIAGESVVADDMLSLAGQDLTDYFPIPLTTACPTLVTDQTLALQFLNFTAEVTTAVHTSGSQQQNSGSVLYQSNWYYDVFLPKMAGYRKGPLVWNPKKIASEADSEGRLWTIYNGGIYDLTDYWNTITLVPNNPGYQFLNTDLANLWQAQPGTDITSAVKELNLDADTLATNMACISTLFYQGEKDIRLTAKCQVQPDLLLAFSMIIVATILAKFLAALQLGSKRSPELRDKFVICQVPCYTEGEESLKKTIDSLANLNYDDKRKLILIICDGMIIGSGNDRPTPRIVLDILGVDQNADPDPLMFKSVAEGSKQLNYGKVWSGLYEVDGHVVPYIVVAKVGRPSERSRPGNRGKRDSQILAMRFLNRVHFDAEMYPLELEMYHQIKNVIGVDPQLYEYMLSIDADTSVATDSLNRLVSCAADDSRIIGICGETKLDNEQASWWTMIQVYEYFISHHMAKAFESLFGTVTCLPGCFTMYRLRSADKGKPLLISSLIIDDYAESNLDTLHKKNLLSLGEDRYLTTLILKHFPNFKTKFTADAQAMTVAPDRWSVLLSQRRRWINSTVHNLAELMFLPDMCGFCCFGMRFIVIIDLVGTIILPATFVYLIYLIVTVATGRAAIPYISLAMIAAVYGLQAIIFLLRRQWQFIGWLVIYLIAYPVYSFILPVYSFWCFDDFTWGSTRVVVGEGKSKKILSNEDEVFDEKSIPKKKFAEYEAALLDNEGDGRSIRSIGSRRTQSTAGGFSLATKLPAGSAYRGGGDYYRDTKAQSSRGPTRQSNVPLAQPARAMGTGSIRGTSEFGYPTGFGSQQFGSQQFGSQQFGSQQFGSQQLATGYRQSQLSLGSMGVPNMGPRRESGMSGFTNYASFPPPQGSVYSMNPFLAPALSPLAVSQNPQPTDDELANTLRHYLASQDLMTVTKRTARDGLAALYPAADLSGKRDFINQTIDALLTGGV